MTREHLINELLRDANLEIRRYNCSLSGRTLPLMDELVTTGVHRMTESDLDNGARVADARQNIRLFCQSLCAQVQKNHQSIIDDRSFNLVRFSVCPIWPFC